MLARLGVLALVLVCAGSAQGRTIRQVVPSSIAFWTATHGVLGSVIYGPTGRPQGQIASTTDGGRTWEIRWRGPAVRGVAVVPRSKEAWAQVSAPRGSCLDCGSRMIRSRDGGRTWRPAGTAPSLPSFPTSAVGFAIRSRGASSVLLMKSANRGRSWRAVGDPCWKGWGGSASSAVLSFVAPAIGWVVCKGQPGAGNQAKAVYRTVDGGRHWQRLLNSHFEPGRLRRGGLSPYGYAEGISFARTGRGLLWQSRGRSFLTTNGGRNWRPLRVTVPDTRTGQSGWFVSHRVAFLLVRENEGGWELLRTKDGGRNWRLMRAFALR